MRFRLNDNRSSGYRGSIERPYDYPYDPNRQFGGKGRSDDLPRPRPQQEFYYSASSKGGYGD